MIAPVGEYDLVVRGAELVDGTGRAPFGADLAVAGGAIAAIGDVDGRGAEEIDGTGLVLAPGWIDPHTHLDANLFWDPDLTPSCSYGVTTVVIANCGYGLAPLADDPDRRAYVLDALSTVEQIPREGIDRGVPLDWGDLDSYVARLERTPSLLNLMFQVGHVPVRTAALGTPDVAEREATSSEIEVMAGFVRRGLELGAVGFSTDQVVGNIGPRGGLLPGQVCADDELLGIAAALGRGPGPGLFTMAPRALLLGRAEREEDHRFHERLAEASGRPVVIGPCFDHWADPGVGADLMDRALAGRRPGVTVIPQVSARPFELWTRLDWAGLLVRSLPTLRRALRADGPAGIRAAASDPGSRGRLRAEADAIPASDVFSGRWDHVLIRYSPTAPGLVGRDVAAVAVERGVHPIDVALDLALADDLETQFATVMRNSDDDQIGRMLRHPAAMVGASDAGAHILSNTDSCYAVWILQHWVRERGQLTLERAVQMLTADQADLLGLADRGRLAVGLAADLVLFDPGLVATTGVRYVADQPAGGTRLVTDATGVALSVVGGVVATRGGVSTGARSGRLLRPRP